MEIIIRSATAVIAFTVMFLTPKAANFHKWLATGDISMI